MKKLISWFSTPKTRRQGLMIASGLLIAAAFAVDGLLDWRSGYNGMMILAALHFFLFGILVDQVSALRRGEAISDVEEIGGVDGL